MVCSSHILLKAEGLCLTIIVWEADTQMDFLDLFFKEILLVEKKHDGGQREESVVADTVEEMQRLVHAVLQRWETTRFEFTSSRVCRLALCRPQLTTSSSSTSTMSYALRAPQKMMQVTPSKQWIHFFLSDLWPPTSNILFTTREVSPGYLAAFSLFAERGPCVVTHLKYNSLQENCSSMIPVVLTRDRSTSCSVGRYSDLLIRSISLR